MQTPYYVIYWLTDSNSATGNVSTPYRSQIMVDQHSQFRVFSRNQNVRKKHINKRPNDQTNKQIIKRKKFELGINWHNQIDKNKSWE